MEAQKAIKTIIKYLNEIEDKISLIVSKTISHGTAEEIREVIELDSRLTDIAYSIKLQSNKLTQDTISKRGSIDNKIALLVVRINDDIEDINKKESNILEILKSTNSIVAILSKLITNGLVIYNNIDIDKNEKNPFEEEGEVH